MGHQGEVQSSADTEAPRGAPGSGVVTRELTLTELALRGDLAATENPDEFAERFFRAYQERNRETAKMLAEMEPQIREFTKEAPEIEASNCMDGRTNTTDAKGCPPTTVYIRRSHGNVVNTTEGNVDFWEPIKLAKTRASLRTPGKPALFIASAHRSGIGGCCAAHAREGDGKVNINNRARQAAIDQAQKVQQDQLNNPQDGDIFCLAAMKNTDNGAMALYLPSGEQIFDAHKLIGERFWGEPSDVFSHTFLDAPITDAGAHVLLKGKTLRQLLKGEPPPAFADPRTKIALEAYMLKQFNTAAKAGDPHPLLHPSLAATIAEVLKHVPPSLHGFITYMLTWNLSYALDQNKLLERLRMQGGDALARYAGHGEECIGYGRGFEAATLRNNMLLVKPSGQDEEAVGIARDVLHETQLHLARPDIPLVHVNIELDNPIDTWDQYTMVLTRMRVKLGVINKIYKGNKNVRIMTTYSYSKEAKDTVIRKQFFPMNANPRDPRIICPGNLSDPITPATFDAGRLRALEREYTDRQLPLEAPAPAAAPAPGNAE